MSPPSLSARLGVGKDVVTAAAVKLTFVESNESFTRSELLAEAKSATGYYKKSVGANLSNTLDQLVKSGDFTEVSKGTYSLSAHRREELERQFAS